MSSSPAVALQQVRKPYTITKQRERWTEEEHLKFLEALKLYGRAWRRIEEHIGTKTAVQIRSHAQKFFSKLEREGGNGHDIEIPPPRPKRKPSHPYPKKAGLSALQEEKEEACLSRSPTNLEENRRSSESIMPKNASPKGLKLFGKTVLVEMPNDDVSTTTEPEVQDCHSKESPEEESGVESGSASDFQRSSKYNDENAAPLNTQNPEVSSRNQEIQDDPQGAGAMPIVDQMAMNNLIILHYASLLAGVHPGQVNPWQLLSPKATTKREREIQRWQSVTDSNSPYAEKNEWDKKSDSDSEEIVEGGYGKKKRQKLEEEFTPIERLKSSSSSTTTNSSLHGDDEAGSCIENLSTRISLSQSPPRTEGFVPYKRPSPKAGQNVQWRGQN